MPPPERTTGKAWRCSGIWATGEDSVYSLRAFVDLAAARGDAQRAARLLGASEALRESMHLALSPTEQQAHEATLAALRQALESLPSLAPGKRAAL
jgi:hypothetical protein